VTVRSGLNHYMLINSDSFGSRFSLRCMSEFGRTEKYGSNHMPMARCPRMSVVARKLDVHIVLSEWHFGLFQAHSANYKSSPLPIHVLTC